MGLSLASFALSFLFLLNACAVLSERRFLDRIGWSRAVAENLPATSVKRQTIQLLAAIRTVIRIPLIIINSLVIVFLLIFG